MTRSGIFSKTPDVYVEVIVDSNADNPRKTTTVKKKTHTPSWDEPFTLNVADSSILEFKIFSKTKFFDDNLLASKAVKVSQWIRKDSENGKC